MSHLRLASSRTGRRLWLENLEPRVVLSATDLRITEFVASNEDGLLDADGDASDWLEIFNAGSTAVDMSGMHLTDDDDVGDLDKWTFPAGTMIPAGGYRVVFASDKDGVLAGGELHTNFKLSAEGEFLAIVAADGVTVVDAYAPEFPTQHEDVSYGRSMAPIGTPDTLIANGAQARAIVPTSSIYDATWRDRTFNDSVFPLVGPTGFGYENNPGDPINYTAEIATTVPNTTRTLYLRISFNLATLAGADSLKLRMRYDDGFVAYINGERVAEANAPEALQWNSSASGTHDDSLSEQFQEYDITTAIPHLVVGNNVLAIHALNAPGSDMLISPELLYSGSMIVVPEQKGFFDVPTPGFANGTSFPGFVDRASFSVPHGFYTSAQSVQITTSTPGTVIVYTTNGSTPAVNSSLVPTNGTLYTGPISVSATTTLRAAAFKTDYKPSFVTASTYIFLNDVLNQSPTGTPPPGWPSNGAVNGQEINYGIDPDIIALYGAQAVKDSLAALPSISLTTDLANLFDPATGIYVNAVNDGQAWERPASAELIYPDGTTGFTVNAGLRIRGGYARNDFNPKHAFRLYFRSEYGDGKLHYPLFGDEGTDEFDVIDLRAESNYSWASRGSPENSHVREVFARDLQGGLGDAYTRSRNYHLFLDGQYWGIYMTQERVQEDYAATYLGGNPEDYDIVKHGVFDGGGTQVNEGNDLAWSQLFSLAQNLAGNPAANANNYWAMQGLNPDGTRNPALPVLLDVDNLINYWLIIVYTGGFDTGISRFLGDNEANNWYGVYNRVAADQGFQFFMHDNEHSLGDEEGGYHGTQFIDRTGPFNQGNQSNYAYFNPVYLHQDLLAHPNYRQRIIDKVQQYFFNDGPMTPAASIARMAPRIAEVDPAIIAESARWGDSKAGTPFNKSHWQAEINWLLNTYLPSRTATVVAQLSADGFQVVPPVPPPVFSISGGAVPANTPLTLSAPGAGTGAIIYTIDGSDPRLPDGGINIPSAMAYTAPVSLANDMTIKARFRTSGVGTWSALVQATFDVYPAGDYVADGVVDGTDFLSWQRQLGSPADPAGSGADGDRNGVVDGGDLAAWQNNFGGGGQVVVAASAVAAAPFALPPSAILSPPDSAPMTRRHAEIDQAHADAAVATPPLGESWETAPSQLRAWARGPGIRPDRRSFPFGWEGDLASALDAAMSAADFLD